MTAYFLWLNEEGRAEIKNEQPDLAITEIAKVGGEKWRNLDEDTKKKYEEKHKELKERYDEEYKEWFESGGEEAMKAAKKEAKKEEVSSFTSSISNYKAISSEEKEAKREKLTAAATYGYVSGWSFESETYYKVAWQEAMDLVRSRRVYLEAGYAYIPSTELLSLVVGVFRSKLSHNLVLTCRALPALEDDTRLVNMVQNLDKR